MLLYLGIPDDQSTRIMFRKLRISAYTLIAINDRERSSPKIPIENRLCKYCDIGEIENELHFIMKYNVHRNRLFLTLTCHRL